MMGLQKFYVLSRLGILFTLLKAVAVYLMLTAGYGIIALAVFQFSSALIQNLLIVAICRRTLPSLSLRWVWPRRDEAVRLLNYGKYVLVANVGDKIVFATDSLIVGMFLPISALTYYAIGGTLIEQFRSFITSMATIFNPLSSSLEAQKEGRALATVVTAGARAAMVLGLPVCIGFFTLGERFIGLWMGPEYAAPAGQILVILAAGHLIGLPYYTISGVLYGLGRHHVVAYSRVFEGIVNLSLSVVLVQRYGLPGVALGTVIPHIVVVAGILPPLLTRWVPINLREYYVAAYLRPFAASLPFVAVCLFIAREIRPGDFFTFFASISIGLVAYVLPCWFIVLSATERAMLTAAVRQRLSGRRPAEGLS